MLDAMKHQLDHWRPGRGPPPWGPGRKILQRHAITSPSPPWVWPGYSSQVSSAFVRVGNRVIIAKQDLIMRTGHSEHEFIMNPQIHMCWTLFGSFGFSFWVFRWTKCPQSPQNAHPQGRAFTHWRMDQKTRKHNNLFGSHRSSRA